MIPGTTQERFERVLNWMITNLEVSASVYRTTEGNLRILPGVTIGPNGSVTRSNEQRPVDFQGWQLNSAAALLACCYIDALGKVLTKNTSSGQNANLERFRAFVNAHMHDFVDECQQKGGGHSIDVLYARYRCGFVHQFADRNAHWDRRGRDAPYWFARSGESALNVDRFVRGVVEAIDEFRSLFPTNANYGPDHYANFLRWLGV